MWLLFLEDDCGLALPGVNAPCLLWGPVEELWERAREPSPSLPGQIWLYHWGLTNGTGKGSYCVFWPRFLRVAVPLTHPFSFHSSRRWQGCRAWWHQKTKEVWVPESPCGSKLSTSQAQLPQNGEQKAEVLSRQTIIRVHTDWSPLTQTVNDRHGQIRILEWASHFKYGFCDAEKHQAFIFLQHFVYYHFSKCPTHPIIPRAPKS